MPNLLTLLSLLLFLAAGALLIRSYRVGDWVTRRSNKPSAPGMIDAIGWTSSTENGVASHVVSGYRREVVPGDPTTPGGFKPQWHWGRDVPSDVPEYPFWSRGFQFERFRPGDEHTLVLEVGFPLWLPAVLSALPPALWVRRRLKRSRRARAGHCPRCGYDLRATPGRCPECGTAAAAAGATA